jgi:hypothetical protein
MTTSLTTSLGRCCICETYVGVTNAVMLDRRAPVPGTGWGCVVCRLPNDGAAAVLCDGCLDFIEAGVAPIYVCDGYAKDDRRTLFCQLPPERFDHDEDKHRQEEEARP